MDNYLQWNENSLATLATAASILEKLVPPHTYTLLIENYNSPDRHYHNLDHILMMLMLLQDSYDEPISQELVLATLFHDLVYVAGNRDNEELSAEIAYQHCGEYYPTVNSMQVRELILATAHHGFLTASNIGHEDTCRFLDADMAILGFEHDSFKQYDHNIRLEYVNIGKSMFNSGRRAFLQHLLSLDSIYLSDYFRSMFENQARTNINWALEHIYA